MSVGLDDSDDYHGCDDDHDADDEHHNDRRSHSGSKIAHWR